MSRRATFGLVGGYGATGRLVASELLRTGEDGILIGGRDAAKLTRCAAELGARVLSAHLDVMDAETLARFCRDCSVVINCAGPVTQLGHRVAQAALRERCHYVDPAGMSVVKESLQPRGREIEALGLSFVVSAGWTPGISEVLPVYAHARAITTMDSIDSVRVCFSDSGDWSDNALRDGIAHLQDVGLARPGYFRKGRWVHAGIREASRTVDLGAPLGSRRFSLFSTAELEHVGRTLIDCKVLTYSYVSGLRNVVAAIALALLPVSEASRLQWLKGIFRRNRLSVGGFVVVDVLGWSGGRSRTLRSRVLFDVGRHYWINALSLATVARMITSGTGVRAGVHFLADAVDPAIYLGRLREAGVEQVDSLSGS